MKVITISRVYGAGGHSIGKKVAETLGIEFYDKDIIKETALAMGIDPELIKAAEEHITKGDTLLRAISPISYDYKNTIFNYERNAIVKIASEGPCVILGRCADDILAKAGIPSLNVFLYADDIHRAARVSELIGSTNPNEIQKKMQKTDFARHAYYEQFTGKHWGNIRNYRHCPGRCR